MAENMQYKANLTKYGLIGFLDVFDTYFWGKTK